MVIDSSAIKEEEMVETKMRRIESKMNGLVTNMKRPIKSEKKSSKAFQKFKRILSKQIRKGSGRIPTPTQIKIRLQPQEPRPVFTKSSYFTDSDNAKSDRMTRKGGFLSKFWL